MITLLSLTFATSALDSLNPVAIAQQLSYQALTQKKKDSFLFILGLGSTNFLIGISIYLGMDRFAALFYETVLLPFPFLLPMGAILLAGGLLFHVFKKKENTETSVVPIHLTQKKLFSLGVLACLIELSSALPYFAFLSILITYQLPFVLILLILFLYTLIYSFPLLIIYFLSLYFERYLDPFYTLFTKGMTWFLQKIFPLLLVLLSLGLLYYGARFFFS